MIEIISASVPIEQIVTGERFRVDLGNIADLQQSINDKGLLHPITVIKRQDGKYDLAAGGRRLVACANLGWSDVPVRIFPQSDEYTLRLIELTENLHRQNLAWTEEVALKKRVHELQVAKFGTKTPGPGKDGWTIEDSSKLIGQARQHLAYDLQLADALAEYPTLNLDKCKTKTEALRVFNAAQELAIRAVLADRAAEIDLTAVQSTLLESYKVCDTFEGLAAVADESIDLIDLDPPYNIDLHRRVHAVPIEDDMNDGLMATGVMAEEDYAQYLTNLFNECKRVLKPSGWIIYWFGMSMYIPSVDAIEHCKLKYSLPMALWLKTRRACRNPDFTLSNRYDPFFYLRKGDAVIAKLGGTNVFDFPCIHGIENYIHPTEKPVELMQSILDTFVHPGATILVPYLGSGNTLLAAANLGMKAFGFEHLPRLKDAFRARVMESQGQYKSYKGA